MTTFNIFYTTHVRIGVRDAPHIWGAGEIRDAGERRLFGGLARNEPFVTPHVWGTGEISTEISAPYLGRWGNKHWKSRRIYVALGHDELRVNRWNWIRMGEMNIYWIITVYLIKSTKTGIINFCIYTYIFSETSIILLMFCSCYHAYLVIVWCSCENYLELLFFCGILII